MFVLNRRRMLYRQHIRQIETICRHCQWLDAKDKTLLQMVFEKGSTFEAIARLTGRNPSTVSRRFHRLLHTLIARQLISPLPGRIPLNRTDCRIIQDYFLRGRTQKAIARKRNISLYRVRSLIRRIRSAADENSADRMQTGKTDTQMENQNLKGAVTCTR